MSYFGSQKISWIPEDQGHLPATSRPPPSGAKKAALQSESIHDLENALDSAASSGLREEELIHRVWSLGELGVNSVY